MIGRLMEKKIILWLLGLVTAAGLFCIFLIGMDPGFIPAIGNTLMLSYIVVPTLVLLLAIYRFKTTKDRRLLTYALSVLASIVAIPIVFFIGLFLLVAVFGIMPTPS